MAKKLTNAQLQTRIQELEAKLQATEVAHAALTAAHKELRSKCETDRAYTVFEHIVPRWDFEQARVTETLIKGDRVYAQRHYRRNEHGFWSLLSDGYGCFCSVENMTEVLNMVVVRQRPQAKSKHRIEGRYFDDGSGYKRKVARKEKAKAEGKEKGKAASVAHNQAVKEVKASGKAVNHTIDL